jgi:ABC-2 type transport system permease protein
MNKFTWLLKREFWEHKGAFFWTPIVVGGVMTFFIVVSLVLALSGLKGGMQINGADVSSLANVMSESDKAEFVARFTGSYPVFAMPIFIALAFCIFFFCLGALFDERKDRSVLFWKSLPLSDSTTVLSKVVMALLVAPLIALAAAVATSILLVLFICLGAAFAGVNIFSEVFSSSAIYLAPLQLIGMLPIYAMWALPTVGWLLMVSAWARSKPFLWAVGVPVMLGILIAWISKMSGFGWDVAWFWKNIIGRLLVSVLPGSWLPSAIPSLKNGGDPSDVIAPLASNMLAQSWQVLGNANIWIGVAVGAAMIYAAIRLRRWRDEG